MPSPKYKFADFVIDFQQEALSRAGKKIKLNHRPFQILRLLIENAGKIVTKEEFAAQIWFDTVVEDNNLTVAVAQIRKALAETKELKFIETIPRKGYRFVVAVEAAETESSESEETPAENPVQPPPLIDDFKTAPRKSDEKPFAKISPNIFVFDFRHKIGLLAILILSVLLIGNSWRSPSPAPAVPTSIAVLPLAPGGDEPEQIIFAAKLTRDLTVNLGRIAPQNVLEYESAAVYDAPNIDLESVKTALNVEAAIIGTIIKANGEKLVIEIRLIDLTSNRSVWEKKYSFKPADLAQSQYLIVRDLAKFLGGSENKNDAVRAAGYEAYQAYLAARYHLGKRTTKDYDQAIENFSAAIAKDAAFADAHAGLATTHILRGMNLYAARGLSASSDSLPAAHDSARRALTLNPDCDEALSALAFVNYRRDYDWHNAEKNFGRAIEINPNNVLARRWRAEFLHKSGRFDEGFAAQQAALILAPNSPQIFHEMAWGNYLAGRFEEAAACAENGRRRDPHNAAAIYNASEIYEQKNDHLTAAALWLEAMAIEEASQKWIATLAESSQKNGYPGFVRAKVEWLESLVEKDYVFPTDLAKGYAALGDDEKALHWLEKGAAARVPDSLSIKYAPAFKNLQQHPRFQTLVKQMNFPQ